MNNNNILNITNLGSIAKVQTGPFGSQLHEKDYVEQGVPIITVEHLGYGRIIKNDIPCVSESDVLRLKKFLLKTGDIVFSRVGSVDRSVLIRQGEDGWMFSGRCLRIRVTNKDVIPAYLYYYFTQNSFRQYVRNNAVGATMPSLNSSILRRLKVIYPSLIKQKQVNDILNTIDDALTNNYARIQLLEESAQLLFKEWFVYFRFPGYKKVKVVDGVLEGWKTSTVKYCISFISRGPLLEYISEGEDDGVPVLNQKCIRNGEIELDSVEYAKELSLKQQNLYLKKFDILINSMGEGTLGRVSRNLSIKYPIIIHNCITIIRANENIIKQTILFYQISTAQTYLETMGLGSTGQTSLKKEVIERIKILIPPEELQEQFDSMVKPIWLEIGSLKLHSQKLAQARDLLLPRLMNGTLRVK